MKNKNRIFHIICHKLILCILILSVLSQISFARDIDYTINSALYIYNDETVNLLEGGVINYVVSANNNSKFNLLGGDVKRSVYGNDFSQIKVFDGTVQASVYSFDNSFAEVTGGIIGDADARQNGHIIFRGGTITNWIMAWDNASVEVYGGTLGSKIKTYGQGNVTLYGSNFKLNGVSIDYGTVPSSGAYLDGILTGILLDGNPINCELYIDGVSSVTILPEPATLLLLGLGGLFLRKRK